MQADDEMFVFPQSGSASVNCGKSTKLAPEMFKIDEVKICNERGNINILTEDYTLLVNNIFASSACKGDGGNIAYYLGKMLYTFNSKFPSYLH